MSLPLLKVKKLHPDAKVPEYGSPGAAGLDLFANEDVMLQSGQRQAIKTDISMEIPESYVGLIWDRSGNALKKGLHTLAGVIDSDYRGNIAVIILNTSGDILEIKKGDKIAQILIQHYERFTLLEEELSQTQRGTKGFGSTDS